MENPPCFRPVSYTHLDVYKRQELEGFEADDIIGTVAREAEEQGLKPLIITGDKDELQLATEKTKVLITRRGISQFELYDRQAMIDKYGFTPEQFIDFKGLMGDSSDNIPGIPGAVSYTHLDVYKRQGRRYERKTEAETEHPPIKDRA